MEELKSIQGFYLTRMGGPILWGVQREKRGSRSSCIAELKAVDQGIEGMQCLRHLMKQIGLPDIDCPTPILNDNRGAIGWIDSGCRPSKKLRHENLAELGIAEAKEHNEVSFYWIPGKASPAGTSSKEGSGTQRCCSLGGLVAKPRGGARPLAGRRAAQVHPRVACAERGAPPAARAARSARSTIRFSPRPPDSCLAN